MQGIVAGIRGFLSSQSATKLPQLPEMPPEVFARVDALVSNYTKLSVKHLPQGSKLREYACNRARGDLLRLAQHPLTDVIVVQDDCLVVKTHMVTIKNKRIGTYAIVIMRTSSSDGPPLLCFNLSQQVNGHHGPHIYRNGKMCVSYEYWNSIHGFLSQGRLVDVCLFAYTAISTTSGMQIPLAKLEMWKDIPEHGGTE